MDPTTRPDDELAQQAPLVPDLGHRADTRTDGGRATDGERPDPPTGRTPVIDPAIQRAYDDELAQQAPLVPDLGADRRAATDAEASRR